MKKKLYNTKIHIFDFLNGKNYIWDICIYARNEKSAVKQAKCLARANFHHHYQIGNVETIYVDDKLFKYIFI